MRSSPKCCFYGKTFEKRSTIRLRKGKDQAPAPVIFRIAKGTTALAVSLDGTDKVASGGTEGGLEPGKEWGENFPSPDASGTGVPVTRNLRFIEIKIPSEMTAGNPETLAFECQ